MDAVSLPILIVVIAPLLGMLVLFIAWRRARRLVRNYESRFAGMLNAEAEFDKLRREASDFVVSMERDRDNLEKEIESIRSDYKEKRRLLEAVKHQVALFDERLSFSELGVYEPHFDFNDSETYKSAITTVRDRQKAMVKNKSAVTCPRDWKVDGSTAKGRTMVNRQIRLTLRAFNNECEAAIANVRWNNVNAMEGRIRKAHEQLENLNESVEIIIDPVYLELKLEELFLTHEQREQKKREKDERAERARAEREEQRLIRDAEKAAAEEESYQDLLDKAKREAAKAVGADAERLNARVTQLEAELAEAHAKAERAKSMAEMTRTGYVYIISNIGSFGEGVVKIGLTRRIEPEDRVRELGDASVPFLFDTHALIYSEDAPALENALHNEFSDRRVNAANMRKEFFYVALDEVEGAVKRMAPEASFFKDREAQEYHETQARRRQAADVLRQSAESALPETI